MSSSIIALVFLLFAIAGILSTFILGWLWRDFLAIRDHRRQDSKGAAGDSIDHPFILPE